MAAEGPSATNTAAMTIHFAVLGCLCARAGIYVNVVDKRRAKVMRAHICGAAIQASILSADLVLYIKDETQGAIIFKHLMPYLPLLPSQVAFQPHAK